MSSRGPLGSPHEAMESPERIDSAEAQSHEPVDPDDVRVDLARTYASGF